MGDAAGKTRTDRVHNPLVTFAVVSFNSEKFIRDAVEGAFSQTYEPLEILFSDDCSTDRSFEIMNEMAANYPGPHSVRVIRNPMNLGVLGHSIALGKIAKGEIVIGSAGDDVSLADRTARTVDAFVSNPNAGCVYSPVIWIDENGQVIHAKRQPHITRPPIVFRSGGREATTFIGCSAAYKKWVFDMPITADCRSYPEDMVFSFYLDLLDADAVSVDVPLVKYRVHPGAASNIVPDLLQYEKLNHNAAIARLKFFDYCEGVARDVGKSQLLNNVELDRARAAARDLIEWPVLSLAQRLTRVLRAGFADSWPPDFGKLTWGASRLWGRYPRYQPRLFISRFQRRYRA